MGDLRTTYSVHLWLTGKCVEVLIELFSLGVTDEALQAKIDRKSAISLQCDQFDPTFKVERVAPTNHFCMDIRPMNALQLLSLTVFTPRNFVADFLQAKCDFFQGNDRFAF